MHTLGRVKNAALARGDRAEPEVRLRGETEVVSTADRLVANTDEEAHQLVGLYGADPAKVWTVNPGVDSRCSGRQAAAARRRLGLPPDGVVVVFAAGCSRSRPRTSCCTLRPSWCTATRSWPAG